MGLVVRFSGFSRGRGQIPPDMLPELLKACDAIGNGRGSGPPASRRLCVAASRRHGAGETPAQTAGGDAGGPHICEAGD